MNIKAKLTELPSESLKISTQRRSVRIDDATEEVEQTYLTLEGNAVGYRWLANHLEQMARSVERDGGHASNILAPRDFKNRPVALDGWDSIDFVCEEKQPSDS